MPRAFALTLLVSLWGATAAAQGALNVTLVGQLDPVPIRYSGSWGYTDAGGAEYALLGCNTGVSIVAIDATPLEVAFIPGPTSNWHEITVVGDHAYAVSEGSGVLAGMQVIDLGALPVSASLVTTYTGTFQRAHMIQSDVYHPSEPYVYVAGTQTGQGVHILDVTDPANPVEVGQYAPGYYIHDLHVRGARMYASAIYEGFLDVVDITDKTQPLFLKRITYPGGFTHSSWTTSDASHLFVCDEVDGLPARMWNIADLDDIYPVAEYTANSASLVHNPYGLGDWMVLSHNTEGLRILDVADPGLPVEVGYYDTYAGASGGFHGLWSAYPFFPSGKIIGGNREDGLYVWEFAGVRAGRLYGTVYDAATATPITGAEAAIVEAGVTDLTAADGAYALGALPSGPGGYTLRFSAPDYQTLTMNAYELADGASLTLDVQLAPLVTGLGDAGPAPAMGLSVAAAPNPFNPYTRLDFELPNTAPVRLQVFDARGALVRTLVDGVLAAGRHAHVWAGRDQAGRRVASGTYLYRLRADGAEVEGKLQLVR